MNFAPKEDLEAPVEDKPQLQPVVEYEISMMSVSMHSLCPRNQSLENCREAHAKAYR